MLKWQEEISKAIANCKDKSPIVAATFGDPINTTCSGKSYDEVITAIETAGVLETVADGVVKYGISYGYAEHPPPVTVWTEDRVYFFVDSGEFLFVKSALRNPAPAVKKEYILSRLAGGDNHEKQQ